MLRGLTKLLVLISAITVCTALSVTSTFARDFVVSPSGGGTDCTEVAPCGLPSNGRLETAYGVGVRAGDVVTLRPGDYPIEQRPSGVVVPDGVVLQGTPGMPRPRLISRGELGDIYPTQIVRVNSDSTVRHIEARLEAPLHLAVGVVGRNAMVEDVVVTADPARLQRDPTTREGTSDHYECGICIGGQLVPHTDGVQVRNSTVYLSDVEGAYSTHALLNDRFYSHAVQVSDGRNVQLRHVTAVAASPRGVGLRERVILVSGFRLHTVVNNSIFRGGPATTDSDVFVGTDSDLDIAYSNYRGNRVNVERYQAGREGVLNDQGQNQTSSEPLFLGAGDFHQRLSSPTVDAGVSDPLSGLTDFDGQERERGFAPDIGADELNVESFPTVIDPEIVFRWPRFEIKPKPYPWPESDKVELSVVNSGDVPVNGSVKLNGNAGEATPIHLAPKQQSTIKLKLTPKAKNLLKKSKKLKLGLKMKKKKRSAQKTITVISR